jgi:hypothetical protein
VADSWLHEAVRRQTPELWPTAGSYIVTVCKLTGRCVKLFMAKRNVSLYCTPPDTPEAATVAYTGKISGQISVAMLADSVDLFQPSTALNFV